MIDQPPPPARELPAVASDETLRSVQRAAGGLATRAVGRMEQELPWFRSLSAEQRSWVTLVAQAGINGYIDWVNHPTSDLRSADQVFGAAPRALIRAVSLRRTVELVRLAITVAEEELPTLAVDQHERHALRESLLRYSREIAFAAAAVYATAAETRGSWDARIEAAVVDGLVRGEDPQSLASRAGALHWDSTASTQVIVGAVASTDPEQNVAEVAIWARGCGRAALAAVHGTMLVVLLAGADRPDPSMATLFGLGAVVRGSVGPGFSAASLSAAEAIAGYRVAHAWPGAPRLVDASELLAERVVTGDPAASETLRREVFAPLAANSAPLVETLDAYLAHGGALEPAARSLFVHPNTMRYRLRRVADLTGRDPWVPRDLMTLSVALIVGRLDGGTPKPVDISGRSEPLN